MTCDAQTPGLTGFMFAVHLAVDERYNAVTFVNVGGLVFFEGVYRLGHLNVTASSEAREFFVRAAKDAGERLFEAHGEQALGPYSAFEGGQERDEFVAPPQGYVEFKWFGEWHSLFLVCFAHCETGSSVLVLFWVSVLKMPLLAAHAMAFFSQS